MTKKANKARTKAKAKAIRKAKTRSWSNVKPKVRMGRPLIMGGPLGELARAMGSRMALCAYLGIDQKTIHRWWRGEEIPRKPMRMLLAIVARKHGVEPPYGTDDDCPEPKWIGQKMPHEEADAR